MKKVRRSISKNVVLSNVSQSLTIKKTKSVLISLLAFFMLTTALTFAPNKAEATTYNITTTGNYAQTDGLSITVSSFSGNTMDFYGGTGTGLSTTDISSPVVQRWDRRWRLNNNNGGGSSGDKVITFIFDFSLAGFSGNAGTSTDYRLLYRTTGSGSWTASSASATVSGDEVTFTGVTITGGTDYDYTLGTINTTSGPLPVKLNYITSKLVNGKVLLDWMTSTEINNDRFEIERKNEFSDFQQIGIVKGSGNSNQNLKYEFIDNQPGYGTVFYRLKQIDYDGKSEYSPIVSPKPDGLDTKINLTMYPNPIGGPEKTIVVNVPNVNHPEGTITISDLNGRSILHTDFPGSSKIIDVSTFPLGIYVLTYFNPEGMTLNRKLIVQQ